MWYNGNGDSFQLCNYLTKKSGFFLQHLACKCMSNVGPMCSWILVWQCRSALPEMQPVEMQRGWVHQSMSWYVPFLLSSDGVISLFISIVDMASYWCLLHGWSNIPGNITFDIAPQRRPLIIPYLEHYFHVIRGIKGIRIHIEMVIDSWDSK